MIYFVRHGSTDWNDNLDKFGNRAPKCQGRADVPLNERGIKQAKTTAEQLRGIKFDRIICSPLIRAVQTCKILNLQNLDIEIDPRLIERDFGEFEGKTREDFNFDGFSNEFSKQEFKFAETISQVKNRIKSLLKELSQKPDENVLIVSHGAVGCFLISYFKGIPKDGNYLIYEPPHGKAVELDFKHFKKDT